MGFEDILTSSTKSKYIPNDNLSSQMCMHKLAESLMDGEVQAGWRDNMICPQLLPIQEYKLLDNPITNDV